MALRNAFEEMATESLLRRVLDALRFARDQQDRMRVVIDNQPNAGINMNNTTTSIVNAGQQPSLFSPGSWNVMDAREEFRDISLQSFQNTRSRWTIT